ncbi:MAG: metal-dependent hydrolase [archaeon]
MDIKFLGHAGFIVEDVLIDPWLERMESFGLDAPYTLTKEDKARIKIIIITHGHEDHMLGAINLAKEIHATMVGMGENIGEAMVQGIHVEVLNIGGPIDVHGWKIQFVPAFHSGNAAGVVLSKNGKTTYHAGDTGLFSDMKLIGELHELDVALLPIGGRFTMDGVQAAKAAAYLNAKHVIPMHYNTFPLITADPEAFKALVEKNTSSKVKLLHIGETVSL